MSFFGDVTVAVVRLRPVRFAFENEGGRVCEHAMNSGQSGWGRTTELADEALELGDAVVQAGNLVDVRVVPAFTNVLA